MQYKDGKIKDLELYFYDVNSVLKTLADNKAAIVEDRVKAAEELAKFAHNPQAAAVDKQEL